MDNKVDEKLYRQIEKNLSNNINDQLFVTGRLYGGSELNSINLPEAELDITDLTQNKNEFHNPIPTISRAEYIRQAREACLRQLSATQAAGRVMDYYHNETDSEFSDPIVKKRVRNIKLFGDKDKEEPSEKEIASFRSLIIRTVCAVIIFTFVFIIDWFEIKFGSLNHEVVREFVTGKDLLQEVENIFASLFK